MLTEQGFWSASLHIEVNAAAFQGSALLVPVRVIGALSHVSIKLDT